jgi:hypothetical protein
VSDEREVGLGVVDAEVVGDDPGKRGGGGDEVVGADGDAGGVEAVVIARQVRPVAFEQLVVAPSRTASTNRAGRSLG